MQKQGRAASTSGRLANWFEAETQPYFAGQHGWNWATVPGEDPLQAVVLALTEGPSALAPASLTKYQPCMQDEVAQARVVLHEGRSHLAHQAESQGP